MDGGKEENVDDGRLNGGVVRMVVWCVWWCGVYGGVVCMVEWCG